MAGCCYAIPQLRRKTEPSCAELSRDALAGVRLDCGGTSGTLPRSTDWSRRILRGSILLNWLGQNEFRKIAAACAISVPYKLALCADRLSQGFSKIYQQYLMGRLKRSAVRKWALLKNALGLSDLSQIMELKTLWEFDDLLTAPLHGFKNVRDYYEKASCRQYLTRIQIPTLLVHALDDPFMVPEVVPQASELSDLIQTAFVPVGGHVGFVSGSVPGKEWSWLSRIVPSFFETNFR